LRQAEEGNEMDLVEGEIVEHIEQIDGDWWSGVGAGGAKSGLFPGTSYCMLWCSYESPNARARLSANYVEIIEQLEVGEAAQEEAPAHPRTPTPEAPTEEAAAPAADEGPTAIALYECVRSNPFNGIHVLTYGL
jgi:hypothetical protein